MDTRTGMIYTPEEIEALDKVFRERMDKGDFLSQYMKPVPQKEDLKEMVVPPTDKQLRTQKVGRNDLCPCGSGSKFKKCCMVV